jgi:uncharacterized protein (TIGR03437 family)
MIQLKEDSMKKEKRTIEHIYGNRLLCAAALLFATQMVHAQSILGSNLIVNGNAESGAASSDGTTLVTSIPGWTRAGSANVLPYNLTGYLLLSDPAPPDRGFQYFYSGNVGAGASTLTQAINVSSGGSIISGGNVKFTASAYLGGVAGNGHTAQVTVAFQNGSGQTFSSISLGPLGYPGSNGMSLQQQIGLVPSGTVNITVTLSFNGAYAVADSLSLVLSTLGTSPGSVLGINLLANPGAEAGPSAVVPAVALYVPGWSTSNDLSVAPYGGPGWISLSDPGPADRGVNLFCKAVSGDAAMYQDLDVSPAAALIDSGRVTYIISAWLGGLNGGASPTLVYTFLDWSGKQLASTAALGPLSISGTGLAEKENSGVLPSGTRKVHIELDFFAGTIDGLADDIAFTLAAPSGPPVITPGDIISAGAFGAFPTIAPGTWIEIYGTNLTASAPLQWSGSQFINGVAPTEVGDVTVSIGGQPAFIDYISPSQVNALVPSNVPAGSVEITLTNANGTSGGFPIYVSPTQPGLLAPSSFVVGGKQYLAALFSDGQTFVLPANAISGVPSRPAMVGETITIYGIGFGPVTGGFTAGTIVTAQNSLTTPIQIFFGSTQATPSYYGLAPGFTGLYQFNVVVPSVSANMSLPISFSLGGVKGTQTLYIAVAN